MAASVTASIALLWRGDPAAPPPDPKATRMRSIFAALDERGARAEAVIYDDDRCEEVRERLLGHDGVLVWVDPISDGRDRARLDPMLREVAAAGVWVSAHPDVILRMGVKSVLYTTRELGWGSDVHRYQTVEAFRSEFPRRLAAAGPRVLKQNRGNGGIGVVRVELAAGPAGAMRVNVLPARSDHAEKDVPLEAFMQRCEVYFQNGGQLIDQALQARVGDGMVRCYMSHGGVVGFSEQSPRARDLQARDPTVATFGMASGKIMHDERAPAFQGLRQSMEADWVPGLQRLLGIATADLPALWDADFLYGPKTTAGTESFVLCEINVSSVSPFPETAGPAIAEAAIAAVTATGSRRGASRRPG